MKIAIIGAGFFGTICGIKLSNKHEVHIYEKKKEILNGASLANQLRFHLGYHYPRSPKTVVEIKKNYKEFINFFGENIFGKTKNFYGVSKINSKVNFKKYIKFLKKNNLKYKNIKSDYFSNKIEGQILSYEKNLNYFKAKDIIKKKLRINKVRIFKNSSFNKNLISNYDKIIVATYDQNNSVLNKLGLKIKEKFKYELVEKIIIKLPKKYKNLSCMVIDGKFVCLDPYVGTKYHLLSDVKYSKLEVIENKFPKFKNKNKKYLHAGIVKNLKISKFKDFIKHGSLYLPLLKNAKYVGSFFVTRVVKMHKEKTDERLNEITKANKKIISILSGKWNTSVGLAKKLGKII